MKQFRLSIAVLLTVWGLAGAGSAVADNGSGVGGVKVEKSEAKKVRLYVPTQESKFATPVEVAVIDAEGNLLYKSVVSSSKAARQLFNLGKLPDGQYFITASNNAWWMSQGVTVRGNTLTVDERSLQQIMEPTLTAYEKNKIEVSLPATNVAQANVTIYDAQSVPVYAETFSGKVRRFDLTSLPDGAYTFVVGPQQKQFTSRVDVRH